MTFTADDSRSSFFVVVIVVLLLVSQGSKGDISITAITVPEALIVGDSTWLNCEWREENDHVYTLKWYLGLHEFYRWTPAEHPNEVKTFPLENSAFQIDSIHSKRGRVRLLNGTLAATGNFRCEISGEAPFFKTSFDTATLIVVDLPDARPVINGMKSVYKLNDNVDLNCTIVNAKPLPEVRFYINNNLAYPEWIVEYAPAINSTTGLQTLSRGLQLKLGQNLVTSPRMLVKCASSYPNLYYESSEKVINIDLPHYYPVTSDFILEDTIPDCACGITYSRSMTVASLFLAILLFFIVR